MKSENEEAGGKAKPLGVSVPGGVCPSPLGASQGLPRPGRPKYLCCPGPCLLAHKSELSPFSFLCPWPLGVGAGRRALAPGDLLVLFQLPGAELRSQSQCNDPVHSSEKEGVAQGLHITHRPTTRIGWVGVGQAGLGSVSRQRSPCREKDASRVSCSRPRSCTRVRSCSG